MSLTVSIGLLVTNSIVVIENIVRHRNSGKEHSQGIRGGTNEIFMAVLASTLTNLIFIPIAATSGIIGSAFKALGLTIVFATVASIFLSFTLTPLLASRLLKQKITPGQKEKPNIVDRLYTVSKDAIRSILTGCFQTGLPSLLLW